MLARPAPEVSIAQANARLAVVWSRIGDSVIAAYEPWCEAFECWTTTQLEDFVKALTRPISA